MTRVTLETTPPRFLLAATIKTYLKAMETTFHDTVNRLQMTAIYVDNVALGASTTDEAKTLYKDHRSVQESVDEPQKMDLKAQ